MSVVPAVLVCLGPEPYNQTWGDPEKRKRAVRQALNLPDNAAVRVIDYTHWSFWDVLWRATREDIRVVEVPPNNAEYAKVLRYPPRSRCRTPALAETIPIICGNALDGDGEYAIITVSQVTTHQLTNL